MATFKFRAEAGELASALDRIKPAKPTVVELRPHADGLTLVTSGQSMSIDTQVAAAAEGEPLRLPIGPLSVWARRVEGAVTAEAGAVNAAVTLTAQRSKLSLSTVLADDGTSYIWSAAPGTEPVELSATTWEAISRCASAASTDDKRPQLCSVNIEGGHVWATDSYRFHVVDAPELEPLGFIPLPIDILPALKVLDLARTTATRDAGNRNRLHLSDGRTHVVVVLLASEPFKPADKLRQLTPAKRPYKLTVDRKAAVEAVADVGSLAGEGPISLTFDGATLTLAAGAEGRDATFEVDASGDAWPGTLGANRAYLADLLDVLTPDVVTFELADHRQPVLVLDGPFTGLLMPVRLEGAQTW